MMEMNLDLDQNHKAMKIKLNERYLFLGNVENPISTTFVRHYTHLITEQ